MWLEITELFCGCGWKVVGYLHQMLIFPSSIKSEAEVNTDVAKGLVSFTSTTNSSLERVFPDSHISEVC